ncbi:hypothetical protein DERP_013193 [Dermatophagoides pteronyssinus]|uniref:Uncharacterized protein n=1 Tax=Dermatophagoides pteronyssinus TaxID=6956 RepID=A0ABQ8J3D8_DERPT|nr:hypothetical protein DERP_013193 [Dermatophagoides pteronyssinus]
MCAFIKNSGARDNFLDNDVGSFANVKPGAAITAGNDSPRVNGVRFPPIVVVVDDNCVGIPEEFLNDDDDNTPLASVVVDINDDGFVTYVPPRGEFPRIKLSLYDDCDCDDDRLFECSIAAIVVA